MIKNDYVSFNIAKLLKEKGFDAYCFYVWVKPVIGDIPHLMATPYFVEGETTTNREVLDIVAKNNIYMYGFDNRVEAFLCPSLELVMKWLREIHNIFIQINIVPHTTLTMEQKYYFFTIYKNRRKLGFRKDFTEECYFTHEQACEAGIKYCLEYLI